MKLELPLYVSKSERPFTALSGHERWAWADWQNIFKESFWLSPYKNRQNTSNNLQSYIAAVLYQQIVLNSIETELGTLSASLET